MIALLSRPPWSLATLFSEKYFGKYISAAYQNVNIRFPFSVWHLSENPVLVNLINYLVNFGVPVQSETLYVPKQKRYRLDYKGNLLDFERMTREQVADYYADEIEQDRQNSPGLRHRNKETIKCRYSYIRSKDKIAESLERIKNRTKPTFKVLKYSTERSRSTDNERISEEINNNYQTKENAYYDIPMASSPNEQRQSLLDDSNPNPQGVLLLFIHGGGLLTQGRLSRQCLVDTY